MLHEQIKIIIRDGIVESVLSDCVQIPAEVEVVDVNRDYADFEQLRAYADAIYADSAFKELPLTYAHFESES